MYEFYCPGCKRDHIYNKEWKRIGDEKNLTIRPSILTRFNENGKDIRCHLFITNGKIEFLNDCTHDLKGKKVSYNG